MPTLGPRRCRSSAAPSVASRVRHAVANEATAPKSWGWSARTRRSERVVAPSAIATAMSTSTRPRSWPRRRCFGRRHRSRQRAGESQLIGQVAEQSGTGMGDDALAAGGHRHIGSTRCYASLRKCPPGSGFCWSRNQQFPSPRGLFRVFRLVSVDELLKGPG